MSFNQYDLTLDHMRCAEFSDFAPSQDFFSRPIFLALGYRSDIYDISTVNTHVKDIFPLVLGPYKLCDPRRSYADVAGHKRGTDTAPTTSILTSQNGFCEIP